MRRILLAVVLGAAAASVQAQAPSLEKQFGIERIVVGRAEAPIGNIQRASGSVRIYAGKTVISADEALIDSLNNDIELRGNVHVRADPSKQ